MTCLLSSDIFLASAAVGLIWLGVAVYLYRIDRKISKIERDIK